MTDSDSSFEEKACCANYFVSIRIDLSSITEKENITEAFFNLPHAVFTINSLYRHRKHAGNNTSSPSRPIALLYVMSQLQSVDSDCSLSADNNVREGMSLINSDSRTCNKYSSQQSFVIHCLLSVARTPH